MFNCRYTASVGDAPKVGYYPSSPVTASSKHYQLQGTNPWEREEREKVNFVILYISISMSIVYLSKVYLYRRRKGVEKQLKNGATSRLTNYCRLVRIETQARRNSYDHWGWKRSSKDELKKRRKKTMKIRYDIIKKRLVR